MKQVARGLLKSANSCCTSSTSAALLICSGAALHLPSPFRPRFSSNGLPAGNSQNVGFIGLGNMGSQMAANLLKAGHSLCVLDRLHSFFIAEEAITSGQSLVDQRRLYISATSGSALTHPLSNLLEQDEAKMQALAAKGASVAKTPRQLAANSDVVITMLPASAQVQEVYNGSNGLLPKDGEMRPSLLIDCSTIDPQTCRLLAAKVAKQAVPQSSKRAIMLDAPVSGGVGGAKAGTLTFMVGGPKEGLDEALVLFSAMGRRVVHCGGPGNGAAAKVCNNLAMGISMAGVSESYALGQRLGIDALTLAEIFNSSSARCWSSDTYNPVPGVMNGVPASQDYRGGFSCLLLTKDLGLALAAAEENGMDAPLTKQVVDMFSTLCKEGHGHNDFSSIFKHTYHGQPQDGILLQNPPRLDK